LWRLSISDYELNLRVSFPDRFTTFPQFFDSSMSVSPRHGRDRLRHPLISLSLSLSRASSFAVVHRAADGLIPSFVGTPREAFHLIGTPPDCTIQHCKILLHAIIPSPSPISV
jgi:hypothetical protein